MKKGITDRARLLLDLISLQDMAKPHSKEYVRWQNIKRGKVRFGADEIEELGQQLPNYRWWLMTGEVMPEIGQTSPDYDQANEKLHEQSAG